MNVKKIFMDGITGFLNDLINGALGAFDSALGNIADVALNSENYMKSTLGMNFDGLYKVIYTYAIYLIVLVFLKKGFEVYVLWNDGDADMDPFIMLTSFTKAIILAVSFETLYGYIADFSLEMIHAILKSFNTADIDLSAPTILKAAVSGFLNNGIFLVIVAVVYIVMYIKLYIDFIKRGLELFILKKGVPFACIGMMNSDGGVFKPYIKKIVQEVLTVLLQVVLLKLSLIFMINGHFFWGIAAINYAITAPQFLQEFIMMSQSGGVTTKISQTAYMANMLRSFSTK